MTGQTTSFFTSLMERPVLYADAPMPDVLDFDTVGEFFDLSVLVERAMEGTDGEVVIALACTLRLVEQGITEERGDLTDQLRETANKLADLQMGSPALYQTIMEQAVTAFAERRSRQSSERFGHSREVVHHIREVLRRDREAAADPMEALAAQVFEKYGGRSPFQTAFSFYRASERSGTAERELRTAFITTLKNWGVQFIRRRGGEFFAPSLQGTLSYWRQEKARLEDEMLKTPGAAIETTQKRFAAIVNIKILETLAELFTPSGT